MLSTDELVFVFELRPSAGIPASAHLNLPLSIRS
jgi:hypothetical protein